MKDNKKSMAISSKTGYNVNKLKDLIKEILDEQKSSQIRSRFAIHGN